MDEAALDRVQASVDELRDVTDEMARLWGEWVGGNEASLAAMSEEDAERELDTASRSKLGEEALTSALTPLQRQRALEALDEIRAWHVQHVRMVAGNLRAIRETRAVEAGLRFLYIRQADDAHSRDPGGTAWIAYLVVGLHLLDSYPEWSPASEEDQLLLLGMRDLRNQRGEQMCDLLTARRPVGLVAPGSGGPLEDRVVHRAANVARRVAVDYRKRLTDDEDSTP